MKLFYFDTRLLNALRASTVQVSPKQLLIAFENCSYITEIPTLLFESGKLTSVDERRAVTLRSYFSQA